MKPFVYLLCLMFCSSLFAQSWQTIRAISLWNGYELSDSWLRGLRAQIHAADSNANEKDIGVDNLLSRAKKAGYTHIIAVFEPRVWGSCTTAAGAVEQRMLFYPEARDPSTGGTLSYFSQAYKKADDSGLILIPLFPVACRGGKEWKDLHPALRGHPAPDLKLNCVASGLDTACATPLADDGNNGFDAHFRELIVRVAQEYRSVRGSLRRHTTSAPPFMFLSYDENWGISATQSLKDKQGKPYYLPAKRGRAGNKPPFINLTLLVGQGNKYDTQFCAAQRAAQKISLQDAVRRLYAYSIWKRARQIREICGDSSRVIIMGQMFDPQFGGAYSWETWAGDHRSPNPADRVTLTDGGASDVLDLPGLDAKQKKLVRKSVVLAHWYYETIQENPSPPFPEPYPTDSAAAYDPLKTFSYFSGKGFDFISYSSLCVEAGQSAVSAESMTSMRNNVAALKSPLFAGSSAVKGRAIGYAAGYWPCFYEPAAACPYFNCSVPCGCRCGNLKANSYWYDSHDKYDQPVEFTTVEKLRWCVDSVAPRTR